MAVRTDQMMTFTYTTYIHAAPEQIWRGLTDPAMTKRYWRHQKGRPEDLPFGLDEGLDLGLGTQRCRARRGRPRTGDPRVRPLPPAVLNLALVHTRVGRRGRHGRSNR